MNNYIIFIVLLFSFFSCNQNTSKDNNKINILNDSIKTYDIDTIKQKTKSKIKLNSKYDALAKFVAGIQTTEYNSIQSKDFYKKYAKNVDNAWNRTNKSKIDSIKHWIQKHDITIPSDTNTLFYPFSGPDFLYANAFFPYSKEYVMFGLEKTGSIPDISNISDELLSAYLNQISYALRFINNKGYFVTKQMEKDLSNNGLDGTLHILLFYLARTNHKISDISYVHIDNYGSTHINKKNIDYTNYVGGIKITFNENNSIMKKTLYYFPINVSDDNIKKNMEFLYFITKLGAKNTYLKSGSYILFDKEFSLLRNLILNQSKKILQDDSGLPFRYIDKNKYEIRLFGTYSQTMKIFSSKYQKDLKKALNLEKRNKKLPFRIGYNSWYDEMVLIYAKQVSNEKKTKNRKSFKDKALVDEKNNIDTSHNGIIYRVQIKSSYSKIDFHSPMFKGLPSIDYYILNGVYKYTCGLSYNLSDIQKIKNKAINKGFRDAFIVTFYKNKRIPLKKAMQIDKE